MSNFTDTYIKALKPLAKRYEEYEGGGFGIRITPNGIKTWIYRYKINGKTDKLTLGHYPTMSLASAKKRFMELSGLRREGNSPKDVIQQQVQKETNTVRNLILEWYSGYAEKSRKKPLQIKQQIDADIIPLLGNLSLEKIQTIDITKALDKVVARGASMPMLIVTCSSRNTLMVISACFPITIDCPHIQRNTNTVISLTFFQTYPVFWLAA